MNENTTRDELKPYWNDVTYQWTRRTEICEHPEWYFVPVCAYCGKTPTFKAIQYSDTIALSTTVLSLRCCQRGSMQIKTLWSTQSIPDIRYLQHEWKMEQLVTLASRENVVFDSERQRQIRLLAAHIAGPLLNGALDHLTESYAIAFAHRLAVDLAQKIIGRVNAALAKSPA